MRGRPWKAAARTAELDLSEDGEKRPKWEAVQLLLAGGVKEPGEPEAGKKDWAQFLTTDSKISMSRMLEVYSLRWGIEVYFKEAKQHLGFLAEHTVTFASQSCLKPFDCNTLLDTGVSQAGFRLF